MKRMAVSMLMLLMGVGCRAPMPTFNPLAPYGSTRVPPPSTGSLQAPTSYYNPSSQPASGTVSPPTLTAPPRTGFQASPPTGNASGAAATSSPNQSVTLASHEMPVATAAVVQPSGSVSTSGASSNANTLRLRGMPVNDATRPQEPAPFVPSGQMLDISQLPDPPTTIRLPQGGSSAPMSGGATSSTSGLPASATAAWQTRPIGSP